MNALEIKELRKGLDLNQEKFGSLLDVHPMTVSKWERGVLAPTPYQMALMADFVKASENPKVKLELKHVLIAAGVIAAVYLLLKNARK